MNNNLTFPHFFSHFSATLHSVDVLWLKLPEGCLQRVNRVMLSLIVFTSSPLPLPLLPALGPEVITVCLHTDSNEPTENFQGLNLTILPLTCGPSWCLLWCWWYLHVGWSQRAAARIIPQHVLAGLLIPTGMSHSLPYTSHQYNIKGKSRSVSKNTQQMSTCQSVM